MLNKYFSSNATNKIDAKGRVSIPANFRKVLEADAQPGLVLIPRLYGEPCIEGLSVGQHLALAARVERMNPGNPKARAMRHKIFGQAHHIPIEDTGRIVLTKDLRDILGSPDDVLFVGLGRSFQMWNPAVYASHQEEMESLSADSFELIPWTDDEDGA